MLANRRYALNLCETLYDQMFQAGYIMGLTGELLKSGKRVHCVDFIVIQNKSMSRSSINTPRKIFEENGFQCIWDSSFLVRLVNPDDGVEVVLLLPDYNLGR